MDPLDAARHGPPADRGPAVLAVTAATMVLSSVFVACRMVCRIFIVKRFTWDDRLMVLAWLFAFFLSFTICLGVANGLGRHDRDISPDRVPVLRHCEYVFSILYNPALMATKTSVLIFYLRLARDTQIVLRIASWATLAVINVAGVILTLINVFQCRPAQAAFNSDFDGVTLCIPLLTEFICAAPVNIVTDLAILALPIPVMTGMYLPSRQKTILVLTFALGIFVTIVDVIRIYYLQQAIVDVPTGATSDPSSRFGGQVDFAYNASTSLMWSAVEANVGMTCACIPTLKPLVLRLLPSILYEPGGNRRARLNRPSMTSVVNDNKRPHDSSGTPSSSHNNNLHDNEDATAVLARLEPALDAHQLQPLEPPKHEEQQQQQSEQQRRRHTFHQQISWPPLTNLAKAPAATSRTEDVHAADDEQSFSRPTPARTSLVVTAPVDLPPPPPRENAVYFGFVNMSKPKNMLQTDARESFKYCTIVAILFVLWGISYGLLNTLNGAVAKISGMGSAQALGLTSAYFGGGYFFGPLLVGEWLLRRDEHSRSRRRRRDDSDYIGGYKVTFIVGLCIYGVGTIIFWPSAVTASYGGFMLSNFVAGFGLSVLEVAANSFMFLCGPPEYGEVRLLVAQAFQAVGSVLSGILAQKTFFRPLALGGGGGGGGGGAKNSQTLLNVQWTYLAITLLCVALGLFFYYMPLPEVGNGELEEAAQRLPVDPRKKSLGGFQLRSVSLGLAILAQYVYVGGQEANSAFFKSLLVAAMPGQPQSGPSATDGTLVGVDAGDSVDRPRGFALSLSDYLAVGHAAFAIGRFAAAFIVYLSITRPSMPRPRSVLGVSVLLCLASSLGVVLTSARDPNRVFIPAALFFFSEGPVWPLIFAIGLRGQGRRTKRAAAFITMGASGPAWIPFIVYGVIVRGGSVRLGFLVEVVAAVVMMGYVVFLTFVRDARGMVDPVREGVVVRGVGELLRIRKKSATR